MHYDDWIVSSFTNLSSREMRTHCLSVADLIFWFLKVATATYMPSHLICSLFLAAPCAMGDLVPWPGIESRLLHRKWGVLTTGLDRKVPQLIFLQYDVAILFLLKERKSYLFIYLAVSHGLWDLSTPSRVKPKTPAVKAGNPAICPSGGDLCSLPLNAGKSLYLLWLTEHDSKRACHISSDTASTCFVSALALGTWPPCCEEVQTTWRHHTEFQP